MPTPIARIDRYPSHGPSIHLSSNNLTQHPEKLPRHPEHRDLSAAAKIPSAGTVALSVADYRRENGQTNAQSSDPDERLTDLRRETSTECADAQRLTRDLRSSSVCSSLRPIVLSCYVEYADFGKSLTACWPAYCSIDYPTSVSRQYFDHFFRRFDFDDESLDDELDEELDDEVDAA